MFNADDIRTLGDGEKITEPGLYAIPITQHHGQPCDGPSVTSSVVRKMLSHGPSKVWATHQLNPNRVTPTEKDSLRLGRAMHALVEGGWSEVMRHFLILPEDMPNRPTPQQRAAYDEGRGSDKAIKSVEAWAPIEARQAKGEQLLSDSEAAMIRNMGKRLVGDEAAMHMLDGMPEITMAARCPFTGLWMLARPDVISEDGLIVDYKKTSTQGGPMDARHCDRVIMKHRYDMQLAFCAEVYAALCGEMPTDLAILFQEDEPPYDPLVRALDVDATYYARCEVLTGLYEFAACLTNGEWPNPTEQIGTFRVPDWYEAQAQQRLADGKLFEVAKMRGN